MPAPASAPPPPGYLRELGRKFLRTVGVLPHIACDGLLVLGWAVITRGVHWGLHWFGHLLGADSNPEGWVEQCLEIADRALTYGTLVIVVVYILFDLADIIRGEWRRFRNE